MDDHIAQGANLVAGQVLLQTAQPCLRDQGFGQVFVFFTVPFSQKGQRILPHPIMRACGGGLAGEPQVLADQGQQIAHGGGNGVELRFDKAVAGMHLAGFHQGQPPLNALRVAPIEGDMVGKGAINDLVVGVAQKA